MASLTDIIFLLLIFFMLTSSFVTPNALKLLLPKATTKTLSTRNVTVSITPELDYYVGQEPVPLAQLEGRIRQEIATVGSDNPSVVVNADKVVPIEHVVNVMMAAKKLGAKVILATEPE